jgi:hypothetical protein
MPRRSNAPACGARAMIPPCVQHGVVERLPMSISQSGRTAQPANHPLGIPDGMPAPSTLAGSAYERAKAIVERCGGGRERHGQWQVTCPAHDDRDPSLSVGYTGDKVLLHCFAGCTVETVCSAIGLTVRDLFADDLAPRIPRPRPPKRATSPPPATAEGETRALELAVYFVTQDVSWLEMEGIQQTFRTAAAQPLQWLWLEQQLWSHGLSPRVVWQVLYPTAEEPFPDPVTPRRPVPQLATRLPRGLSTVLRRTL